MAQPKSLLIKIPEKDLSEGEVSKPSPKSSDTNLIDDLPSSMNDTSLSTQHRLDRSSDVDSSNVSISASSNFADEIAVTCRELVEETVKLELEGQTKDQMELKETNKSMILDSNDSRSSARVSLDSDDDGDEADDWNDNEDAMVSNQNESRDINNNNSRHYQHIELIKKLRLQLKDLEKYAYARGELDHIPASVLAERQTVILDTLRERLSLKIGSSEVRELEIEELKKQIDKEINDLVDPMTTKEHLLNQLKTQLSDLELYISHLHQAIGKDREKTFCACQIHGCSALYHNNVDTKESEGSVVRSDDTALDNGALPRTSKLIRTLITQLICSDTKLRERAQQSIESSSHKAAVEQQDVVKDLQVTKAITKVPQYHDSAVWSIHLDRVILATDSLTNLHSIDSSNRKSTENPQAIDPSLVESVVRRQLLPAIRDLLMYGLVDTSKLPRPSSYTSIFLDPLQLLTSLTCLPQSRTSNSELPPEKVHIWDIIVEYYNTKNETSFKSSSIKTLSQTFNLAPTMSGPIKTTSKQALLIAVENIIETLSKYKPNGPESHFKSFIYTALNWSKLSTWLRLVFKNKSIIKKYYHPFSFVNQPEKIDKFFSTIEVLSKIDFKLDLGTELQSVEKIVSAF